MSNADYNGDLRGEQRGVMNTNELPRYKRLTGSFCSLPLRTAVASQHLFYLKPFFGRTKENRFQSDSSD